MNIEKYRSWSFSNVTPLWKVRRQLFLPLQMPWKQGELKKGWDQQNRHLTTSGDYTLKQNIKGNQMTFKENLPICPIHMDWGNAAWELESGSCNLRGFGKESDEIVGLIIGQLFFFFERKRYNHSW